MPDKAVVLLSGGLDSATALGWAHADGHDCYAISFDYGQRHRHELEAAGAVAASLGVVRHEVVQMDLRSLGGSALTDDAIDVPKHDSADAIEDGVPATYVPARNMVFLSVAIGWAESLGAPSVWIGVNAIDYSGYPDCRAKFIRAFEQAAALGTTVGAEHDAPIRIETPLVDLTKAEIIRRAHELGVDLALTHSCYDPVEGDGTPLACGRCDSCLLRVRGFRDAGVPDPTTYADGAPS